ncbi:MBOAT family protein [Trinickia violacea]|uniref:Probable alginate O-acetylase AlgI n=1 Tax=Trinickia violacea TaxID=2571746 RepID=A0A4P8IRT9_9BURK|nr:MBOAT family O-acyltransferase [Trinickia violacea]QCP50757.1 MBOAT family protein [Trinickia violacea]
MSYLQSSFFSALIVLLLVTCISTQRARPYVVLAGSLLFYATWSIPCLFIMLAAIAVTYVGGRWIGTSSDPQRRKYALLGSIGLLLVSLIFFKTVEVIPAGADGFTLRWLIPIGVSYYTFKAISYLLEVHWENVKPQDDIVKVALYVSFFPQMLSGPIQRPDDFFAQLEQKGSLKPSAETLTRAIPLLLLGAFEKAVLADRIGPFVSALDNQAGPTSFSALLADYGYTLQLFADFSGLTHIALGLGALFGVMGPPNFNAPFSASSIPDFWRRWHMSLTTWLGDYLFLPLRMALRGLGARGLQLSLLINMILIGLWHGFRPTYFVFGVYHGLLLVASTIIAPKIDAVNKRNPTFKSAHRIIAPIVTFHLVVLGQVFFRAPDLGFAWNNLRTVFSFHGPVLQTFALIDPAIWKTGIAAALISLGLGTGVLNKLFNGLTSSIAKSEAIRWTVFGVLALVVVLAASPTGGQFMYAKF